MRLAMKESGEGPRTVALVHGLTADGALWESLTERLVARGDTTVLAVDLRGHGDSARADEYTLARFADDLVESLPAGLDAAIGHSLGGAVLGHAAARLRPRRAVYLDPGFALALPTVGLRGRLFWATAPVSLAVASLAQRRRAKDRAAASASDALLRESANARYDRRMTVGVFRDLAHHPLPVSPPPVPSTLVLSDDSAAVVPDARVLALEAAGWDVVRLPGIGHDFWLEDADATWSALEGLLA